MNKEVRDGVEITVFDDLEEMKWHFHKQLCNSSSMRDEDRMKSMFEHDLAVLMTHIAERDKVTTLSFDVWLDIPTPRVKVYDENSKVLVAEANRLLEGFNQPCRVKVIE
ncbi:hypothetical protein MUO83_07845 [Candidatus Bathyarchaeota archaeon]|nr:hypothetical protein [Candidatus Bathyarchaeota archaeon]